jgi:DNA-binding response OmpR family regulator
MIMAHQILIVDDSRTVRVQLERILRNAGFETVVANDGKQGLELAGELRPAVMILDIQMPGIDGYGVCQELKKMGPPWDHLPVVFLTSLESRALDLLGHEMGAYLQKPVDSDEVLQVVNRFVDCPAASSWTQVK